ncbi:MULTISPECIES: hypothetical protein [unclassified Polaromonas]|jgi:hypothetical protein|uniref:hypothetical protein n=1 Tax=unclassified Polaromonas TaxID=2638319 RepID=UPI000BD7854B|nr:MULTISPECIES: hypothetical protein [unclassified Polaromonas]OYY36494.1 MAG: hypothetical protein B7Y60_09935 [Polaromonas sp. 35-63-35]OYZ22729.1 MAG: hypothetical protein B7Y28_02085 [Polaromonas sp. 16-63-31]OYZ81058.1 MAG: hypothetical protein B7Y09_01065 [Polaromonas sp. 24-63-21]OZA52723.1 MAG: hypothetical protein B7X88_02080 [Polaromonas sp. 17-63-33]OZA88422.1 MAG: hypothetical protein B7X65_07540 [Polaromonas sp. 39-63-25]
MAHPSTSPESWHPTLAGLQRIKQWHLDHQGSHPLEHQLWDAVLTLWVMGWVGWLPAFALDIPLAYPLCLLGMLAPQLYVRWRARAHTRGRLRCDWLELVH